MLTPASEATCPIFTAASLTLDLGPDLTLAVALTPSAPSHLEEAAMGLPGHPPPSPPAPSTLSGTPGAFPERMAEHRRLFAHRPAGPGRRTVFSPSRGARESTAGGTRPRGRAR